MLRRFARHSLVLAGGALVMAACDGSPLASGTGELTVEMSRLGGGNVSTAVAMADARFRQASLDDVGAIHVTVNRVEVHRVGSPADGNGDGNASEEHGWIGLEPDLGDPLDLMALPVEDGLTIASGDLPSGEYDGIRFFFSDATITFSSAQSVSGPAGEDVPAGEPVPLRIPSGEQTGVKVPGASFSVPDGGAGEITVEFDENTSVQNVTVTGTGDVIMAPVLIGEGDEEASAAT